jgi:hypothetical protein
MANTTDSNHNKIDSLITILLTGTKADWKEEMLYSWGWEPQGLGRLGPQALYDINTYKTKKMDFSQFKIYRNAGLSAELSERVEKHIFSKNEDQFILGIHANIVLAGGYKNIVVTNVMPDPNVFGKNALHSEIGYWRF